MANITNAQKKWKEERISYLLEHGREWSETSIKNIKQASFQDLKRWALANESQFRLKIP